MRVLFFLLICILFTGCTQFADGSGWVFKQGLWIIPLVMFIGGGILIYDGYRQSKSPSIQQTSQGQVPGKPIYFWSFKNYRLWMGVAIWIGAIVMIWDTIGNR